jgi:hypothetical protein
MIRKLKSGEYRLYSRKKIPKPANAAIWAHSVAADKPKPTNGRCNTSKDEVKPCLVTGDKREKKQTR